MKTLFMLKLGPLILVVNLFFSISSFAETNYQEKTKDIIGGELRKFIFSGNPNLLPRPLVIDANENMVEIGYDEDILIINFWATWCAPCKKEMPSLDLLLTHKELDNLKIFPINVGQDSLEKSAEFFDDLKIKNLKIYNDGPITLAKKFGLRGVPTSVLINKDGYEFARIIGSINFEDKKFIAWLSNYN